EQADTPGRTRTFDLRIRNPKTANQNPCTSQGLSSDGQKLGVPLGVFGSDSAELSMIAEAWPTLPPTVRESILRLIQSVQPRPEDQMKGNAQAGPTERDETA